MSDAAMRSLALLLPLVTLAAAAAPAGQLADNDAAGALLFTSSSLARTFTPRPTTHAPSLAQAPPTLYYTTPHHSHNAVMRALRSTMLGFAEAQRNPDAVLASAVTHQHCCDANGLADAHFLCFEPPVIDCPILGWVTNQTAPHCTWAGVGCNARGQVTSL